MHVPGYIMITVGFLLVFFGLIFVGVFTYIGDLPDSMKAAYAGGLKLLVPAALSVVLSLLVAFVFWVFLW